MYSDPESIAIRDNLQRTFSSSHGKITLQLLLRWSGFFDIAMDRKDMPLSEAVARRNFMIEVLERAGIFHDENVEDITDALMRVDPKPQRAIRGDEE